MFARALFLVVALSLICSRSHAQEHENLRIEPPASWGAWKKATEQKKDGVHFTAWVPAAQEGPAWRESIAVSIVDPRPSGDATTDLIRLALGQQAATCAANSNVVPPKPRMEGAFTVAYAQFYCTQFRGAATGQVTLVKAIASARRAYVVLVMRRVKPFDIPSPGAINFAQDEAIDVSDWVIASSKYLSSVKLCVSTTGKEDVCSP
jgi:hypothetical protein